MTPEELRFRCLSELGLTQNLLHRWHLIPYESACEELDALKVQARKSYRKLAFKYHPDRNPSDQEASTLFQGLTAGLKEIESLQVERRTAVLIKVLYVTSPAGVGMIRTAPSYPTGTDAANCRIYDASKVVFVRS